MNQPNRSQVLTRLGVLLLLTSLLYSTCLPHFFKGLLSYSWDETNGKIESIQSTTERCHGNYTVRGTVTYSYPDEGLSKKKETRIFKRWKPHKKEEYLTWKKNHARGSRVSVYYSHSQSSLGHWERTYDLKYGLLFSLHLTLGLLFICIGKSLHTTRIRRNAVPRGDLYRRKV